LGFLRRLGAVAMARRGGTRRFELRHSEMFR